MVDELTKRQIIQGMLLLLDRYPLTKQHNNVLTNIAVCSLLHDKLDHKDISFELMLTFPEAIAFIPQAEELILKRTRNVNTDVGYRMLLLQIETMFLITAIKEKGFVKQK